ASSATSENIALPFRRNTSTMSASAARPKARSITILIAGMSSSFSSRMMIISRLFVFFQLKLGDGFAVDFVRAVGQAQRALVRPGVGQVEVLADAAAAMSLQRAVDHAQGHIRSDDLDHGYFSARGLVADRVHHISGFEREQARLFYLYPRFGDVGAD